MKKLILLLLISSTICLSANTWQKTDGPFDDMYVETLFKLDGEIYANSRVSEWGVSYKLKNDEWIRLDSSYLSKNDLIYKVAEKDKIIVLSTKNGIFVSDDRGVSWYERNNIYGTSKLSDIEIVDNKIFALPSLIGNGRLFYTDDQGKTWKACLLNDKDTVKANCLLYKDNTFYAFQKAMYDTFKGKYVDSLLYISTDDGMTWESKKIGYNFDDITSIGDIFIGETENSNLALSYDHGLTWKIDSSIYFDVSSFVKKEGKIYAGTNSGIYISNDSGKTWQFKGNGFSYGRIEQIVIDKNVIYANNDRNGIYQSTDDGDSWRKSNLLTHNIMVQDLLFENDTLFATGGKKGIQFSTDKGDSWQVYNHELDSLSTRLYEVEKKGEFVITSISPITLGKVLVSNDYGINWEEKSLANFTGQPQIRNIVITEDKKALVNTRKGIKYSDDQGKTWTTIEDSLLEPKDEVVDLLITEKEELYAFTVHNGIVKSTDLGNSWDYWIKPDSIFRVIYSYSYWKDREKLFLGLYGISYKGLITSNNNGKTWEKLITSKDDFGSIWDILIINDNILIVTSENILLSKDMGKNWDNINFNLQEKLEDGKYFAFKFTTLGNNLFITTTDGLYKTTLEDLGIITTVENEIENNYLYINLPFPQPAKGLVKAKFYWDINLPMTADKINIYDILGTKINTEGRLKLDKRDTHYGYIEWDCSNVSPGVYLIKINHGTETRTVKVMVGE